MKAILIIAAIVIGCLYALTPVVEHFRDSVASHAQRMDV